MSSSISFSVVIPTYNRAHFIERTIQSVLNQTHQDFELIIINDGSTDQTKDILFTYERYENIQVFHQENRERGASRNTGIQKSTKEYVVFLDSDDLLLETHLETLAHSILLKNKPNFIATKFMYKSSSNTWHNKELAKIKEGFYDFSLFLEGNPLACLFCIKRENPALKLFKEERIYSIMEDWIFLIENTLHDTIYIIDKYTSYLFDHDQRSMRTDFSQVISKRKIATKWLIDNVIPFKAIFIRKINAETNYFFSVHYFLGGEKTKAFYWLWKALNIEPLNTKFMLHVFRLILR